MSIESKAFVPWCIFIFQVTLKAWEESTRGSVVCNKAVSYPIGQLFTLLYSNSNFYFDFQKNRGTTELDIGNWMEEEGGASSREVAYIMALNNPVGPKKCQVKETQMLKPESVSGLS